MKKKLSHIDSKGLPSMVDVSKKAATLRIAKARAIVKVGKKIISMIVEDEIVLKKGPVFQTAILAGVMGAKKTSELIPLCHPLPLDHCQVSITSNTESVIIETSATTTGKTGVEMEALTAASVAALTVYDMCKAISHDITIEQVCLLAKSGGKSDFIRR